MPIRAAVERKREDACRILSVDCVGDEEHLSFDLAIARLIGSRPALCVAERLSIHGGLVVCDHRRNSVTS